MGDWSMVCWVCNGRVGWLADRLATCPGCGARYRLDQITYEPAADGKPPTLRRRVTALGCIDMVVIAGTVEV